jgi:hypothetical protein
MRGSAYTRIVALALVLTTTCLTMPVSAADLYKPKPVLGSVSATGRVEVRGISITEENTLFAGDSIKSLDKAYAKVLLRNGSKLELAEKTEIHVQPEGDVVQIAMTTGMMGFSSLGNSLRIKVQPFEVVGSPDSSGNVMISPTAATVRALKGSLKVRNTKTSESFVVTAGQDRLFGLDGSKKLSLGEIASNVPGPLPRALPQTPAGQTTNTGLAMDRGAWLAVIAGAAAAGVLITTLVMTLNNRDDIKDLGAKIDALSGQIAANQTANQAAIQALQRSIQFSQTAAQVQSTAGQVGTASNQAAAAISASAALTPAQRASLSAQATAAAQTAAQAAAAAATAQASLSALQAAISASGTVTPAQQTQLTTLQNQVNAAVAQVNAAIAALQAVIASANQAGANIPTAPIAPVASASASIPT